jgi:hypothetical protein
MLQTTSVQDEGGRREEGGEEGEWREVGLREREREIREGEGEGGREGGREGGAGRRTVRGGRGGAVTEPCIAPRSHSPW